MRAPQAPMGVTVLAYLGFFVAIASALLGIAALTMGAAGEAVRRSLPALGVLAGSGPGLALLAFAALLGATAWGLLRRRAWAWVVTIALVALSAAGDLARVAHRDAAGLAGVAIVAVLVWYLLRREVRTWFLSRP